jgi:hypothetical protein
LCPAAAILGEALRRNGRVTVPSAIAIELAANGLDRASDHLAIAVFVAPLYTMCDLTCRSPRVRCV